jgi:hypothetical protein
MKLGFEKEMAIQNKAKTNSTSSYRVNRRQVLATHGLILAMAVLMLFVFLVFLIRDLNLMLESPITWLGLIILCSCFVIYVPITVTALTTVVDSERVCQKRWFQDRCVDWSQLTSAQVDKYGMVKLRGGKNFVDFQIQGFSPADRASIRRLLKDKGVDTTAIDRHFGPTER